MNETCAWPLGSGENLEVTIYSRNEGWYAVAGLYIFTYRAANGLWHPLYVGQTDDFSARLPSHEKLQKALQHGATHIHARIVSQESDRLLLERMLIQHLRPALNVQLK